MFFSGKSRNKMVGIDIGTTAAKLVEFSRSGRSTRIDHYAYEPLPPGLIIEHQIKDVEQAGAAVSRLLARSGSKVRRAAVCVSSNSVISKTITVQSDIKDQELEAMVEIEADRVVPYALDDVNIDYVKLGKSQQSAEEDLLQLVVCRKNVIENITAVLEEADIEPAIVDVDQMALSRVNSFVSQLKGGSASKKTNAVMDFGSGNSRLLVFNNDRIIYSRENPYGGRQLIENISQKYGLPQDESSTALRANKLPGGFKSDVLKPFVKTLMQEVLRTLQFFYSSSTHNRIDQLLITGGCAQIGNIDKFIEKRTEVPTSILNPFELVKMGPKIDKGKFRKDIPNLGVAAGLALRGLDL